MEDHSCKHGPRLILCGTSAETELPRRTLPEKCFGRVPGAIVKWQEDNGWNVAENPDPHPHFVTTRIHRIAIRGMLIARSVLPPTARTTSPRIVPQGVRTPELESGQLCFQRHASSNVLGCTA